MNILVLGNSLDAHASHIKDALAKAGVLAHHLDTRLFPTQVQLSWRPDIQSGSFVLSGGHQLNSQDIKSVFWRNFCAPYIPKIPESQQTIAFNDAMSVLRTLLQAKPIRWINSWQAYQFHKEKPLQLSEVKLLNVEIPATLVSNNPQEVIEFCKIHPKTIFKPVYGGSPTQFVSDSHLEPHRLNLVLRLSPVTFQEYISGTNIRTYVIGEDIYSAEIRSNYLDFREDEKAQLIPWKLPEFIQKQCLAITKSLMLEWTAIDWRLKPTGEYIFLEANPSPMFLHFEQQTKFPITQSLVNLLLA